MDCSMESFSSKWHFLYIYEETGTAYGINNHMKATPVRKKIVDMHREASIHHITHAADSHLLQVFLGQQSFPASATSFIIWLGHFPEELHSTDNKSPIMKSYTIRYCITIMQHWQGHNHFCKLVPTSTSVYICMHASAHTYLLVKLWDKVFMTSLSSAQEGISLNCYFQTPSLWQFGTIILQIK